MSMKKTLYVALIATIAAGYACSNDNPAGPDYDALIAAGWEAFAQKDYAAAVQSFASAKTQDETRAEAFTGLGWSQFKQDALLPATQEFADGATRQNATADLFAGWAFVLNARKEFEASNIQADQALVLDAGWQFQYGLDLAARDLHILKASNHFLLGEFAAALAEVQIVNPAFQAEVTTDAGIAALARELERLRANP